MQVYLGIQNRFKLPILEKSYLQAACRTKIIIKNGDFGFLFSFHVTVESFKKTNITFNCNNFSVLCYSAFFTIQYCLIF